MEEIIRNVCDLAPDERRTWELAVGRALQDGQQVVLRVPDVSTKSEPSTTVASPTATLPDWCNVFEGLSDAEIAAIEDDILRRADLTRQGG